MSLIDVEGNLNQRRIEIGPELSNYKLLWKDVVDAMIKKHGSEFYRLVERRYSNAEETTQYLYDQLRRFLFCFDWDYSPIVLKLGTPLSSNDCQSLNDILGKNNLATGQSDAFMIGVPNDLTLEEFFLVMIVGAQNNESLKEFLIIREMFRICYSLLGIEFDHSEYFRQKELMDYNYWLFSIFSKMFLASSGVTIILFFIEYLTNNISEISLYETTAATTLSGVSMLFTEARYLLMGRQNKSPVNVQANRDARQLQEKRQSKQ